MPGLSEVPAQLIRPLEPDDVRCPAGSVAGDAGCHCRIERTVIDGRRNPNSIEAFCLGDYTACPTWRAEKRRVEAGESTALVDRDRDFRRAATGRRRAAEERRLLAAELMESDTEEGRRYRARVARIIGPSPVERRVAALRGQHAAA